MTTHRRRRSLATISTGALLATLLVPLAATGAAADECDTTWTGSEGSSWADPDNWDDAVPGAGDTACIDDDVSLPIVVDGSVTVGSLHVGDEITGTVLRIAEGGTLVLQGASTLGDGGLILGDDVSGTGVGSVLQVDETLTVGGDLTFNRGRITGDGATTVDGELVGPATPRTRAVRSHSLTIGGGELSPTGFFIEEAGTVINTGELSMSAPAAVQGPTSSTLRNEGTFVHSSTVRNWIEPRFDNPGTTEVTGGQLDLRGPGTNTGTMQVDGDATLNFAYSVSVMAAAYLNHEDGGIVGDGTVIVTQFAGLRSEGTYDVGSTEVTRVGPSASVGTWAVDGDTRSLLLDGAALRGQDSGLLVDGDVEFRRGSMDRDGSTFGSLGYVGDVTGDLWLTTGGLKELRIQTRLDVAGGAEHDGGEVRLRDDAELTVTGRYRQTAGLVDLRRAVLRASSIWVDTGARLQGGWLLDTPELEIAGGTFAPGMQPFGPFGSSSSLGTVEVTGDVDLDGTFIVRVRDVDDHDQVAADGQAWLAGTLEVLFDEDTDLPTGTRIPILTTAGGGGEVLSLTSLDERTDDATIAGTFAETVLPELDGDRELAVEYTDDAVYLVVLDTSEEETDEGENGTDGTDEGEAVDDTDPVDDTAPVDGPTDDDLASEAATERTPRAVARPEPGVTAASAGELPTTGGPLTSIVLAGLAALAVGSRLTRVRSRG